MILENGELDGHEMEYYSDMAERVKIYDFVEVALEYIQVNFPNTSRRVDDALDKLNERLLRQLESEDLNENSGEAGTERWPGINPDRKKAFR